MKNKTTFQTMLEHENLINSVIWASYETNPSLTSDVDHNVT